ncbi:Solute carrier 2 (Facilitated glucose transporter) member 8, partial [Blomia tropicalis]
FLHSIRSPLNPKGGSSSSIIELSSSDNSQLSTITMDKETGAPRLVQKPSVVLYLAAASALMGAIGMGTVLGWTGSAFDSMRDENSVPRLLDSDENKEAKTWIGSSMTLGALVGAMISGPMAQLLGRKKALILYSIPFTIGWLMLACANSVALLIVGRVIVGLSAGLLSGTAPSYVVEISIISIRGFLGACFQLCVTIGILLVYLFGAFIHWNVLAGICVIPTLLMAIFMFFMPETPSYLVAQGKKTEAEQSLQALRGAGSDNEQEMAHLEEQAQESQQGQTFNVKSYFHRQHGLPLLLALGLMFFQQFSGINAVMFYASNIFIEAGSSITPKYATIIIGVAQVIATVVGSLLVDRLGRKLLLNISGALHTISTSSLGLYYYYSSNGNDSYGWVPVVSLVIFIIGFSIGYGPIPWLMVAEITPMSSRSVTSAIATAFNWTCAFLITKNFEIMNAALTKHGTFFLFAIFSFLSMVFVIVTLPETKGKSSEEIQSYFVKKSALSNDDGLLKNGNNSSSANGDRVELEKLN